MDGGGFGELRNEKIYLESSGNTKEKKVEEVKMRSCNGGSMKSRQHPTGAWANEELGKLHKMSRGVEKADDARDWTVSIDRLPTRILR